MSCMYLISLTFKVFKKCSGNFLCFSELSLHAFVPYPLGFFMDPHSYFSMLYFCRQSIITVLVLLSLLLILFLENFILWR